jgi:hypothetical protein
MAREGFRVAAEAQGLAVAIKTLGKVDKELKKELVTSMKKAADPLVAEARSMVPATKPLTNWYNWTTSNGRVIGPYNSGKVKRGIKVSQRNTAQRGSSGKKEETIRLLALVSTSAAGAIFDMAGRAGGSGRGSEGAERGQQMIRKLNEFGNASRTLWPAADKRLGDVQDAVRDAIAEMEETLNKELEVR